MSLIRHHNDFRRAVDLILDAFQDRHKAEIDKNNFIFRMINNVGNLITKETGINCVTNRANPGDSKIKF